MHLNEQLKALSRQLGELISEPKTTPKPNRDPVKIIVAVHGIGNQFAYATIRSVADQFCRYMGLPAAIPLGRFRSSHGSIAAAYIPSGHLNFFPGGLGFAEIYWADIPRELVTQGYTLEESKRWARTIVERLQLSETGLKELTPQEKQDNRLLVQVLEEMIQGVAVLGRLLFVIEKAGLYSFNLDKLLNDYLNDVQVVAEFSDERARMLAVFRKVMRAIEDQFPNAEIYIVAHSEGTVVSYLGLLEGLQDPTEDGPQELGIPTPGSGPGDLERPAATANGPPEAAIPAAGSGPQNPQPPRWTSMIKGYMTIGSPLNKHVLFWPDLFKYKPPADGPARRIPWRNYYDKGDPIGFDLRMTRNWMKQSGWIRFFEFNGPEDVEAAQTAGKARQKAEEVRRRAEAIAAVAPAAVEARNLAAEAEQMAGSATARPDPDVQAAKALKTAKRAEATLKEAEKRAAKARVAPSRPQAARAAEGRPAPAPPPLHDFGFTRYLFPGAAHNDYWGDEHVFGHFIQDVVDPDRSHPALKQPDPRLSYREPPRTRLVAELTSYVLPYFFSAMLLLLAVFPLYKAGRACLVPTEAKFETAANVLRNVLGVASLIGGMTILARIPHLSRAWSWRVIALAIFAVSAIAFHYLVVEKSRVTVGSFLLRHGVGFGCVILGLVVVSFVLALVVRRDAPGTALWPIAVAGGLGAVVLVGCWWISGTSSSEIDPAWSPPIHSGQLDQEIHWVDSFHPRHPTFDFGRLRWVVDDEPIEPEKYRVGPVASTVVLATLAFSLGLLACGLSRSYPSLGMKPLIYMGGMLLLAVVLSSISSRQSNSPVAWHYEIVRVNPQLIKANLHFREFEKETRKAKELDREGRNGEAEKARQQAEKEVKSLNDLAPKVAQDAATAEVFRDGPIWPVALAGLVFLYLWWLAALVFDLTFVWHRYIRHSVGMDRLKAMIEGKA